MNRKIHQYSTLDSKLRSKVINLLKRGNETITIDYKNEKHKAILFSDDESEFQHLIILERIGGSKEMIDDDLLELEDLIDDEDS